MLIKLQNIIITCIIPVFFSLVERDLQMSLRRQEFQQFCFGGIAPEGLIDIPHSCFSGQLCFHDDNILSPIQPQDFGQQFGRITVQTIEGCLWLGGNRWAPYLAVFYAKSSAQVVLAHPPHRFSTLSEDRQPTLFVAGYNCMIQCFSRCRKTNSLGSALIVTL